VIKIKRQKITFL